MRIYEIIRDKGNTILLFCKTTRLLLVVLGKVIGKNKFFIEQKNDLITREAKDIEIVEITCKVTNTLF